MAFALLPDTRLADRRRGHAAGDAAGGLARAGRIPGEIIVPQPHQYHGTAAVRSFLRASFDFRGDRRVYLVPTGANTQPALASYLSDRVEPAATSAGLFVLTMADQKIRAITRFHLDELYPRFGLAGSLPGPAAQPQLPQAADR